MVQSNQRSEESKNKRIRDEVEREVARKRAKDVENGKKTTSAVCVSPRSGRVFTTSVQISDVNSELDQNEMTSDNNPSLRAEVYREFQRQVKEMDKTDKALQFKKPSKSEKRYRLLSRSLQIKKRYAKSAEGNRKRND